MKITYTKKEFERCVTFAKKLGYAIDEPVEKTTAELIEEMKEEAKNTKYMRVLDASENEITVEVSEDFVIDAIDLYEAPAIKIINVLKVFKDTFIGIFTSIQNKCDEFIEKWTGTDEEETENTSDDESEAE